MLIKIVDRGLLGEYDNGNYKVSIYKDGTKVRETFDENATEFIPNKPESMDVKICNRCDRMCEFCHENSTPDGELGDILGAKFIETLNPYTEIAIGGGNPLSHPDLISFLEKLKALNLIPNMTVNQVHFMENYSTIEYLINNRLIYGLGVSLVNPTDEFMSRVTKFDNAVIHIINGVITKEQLSKLAEYRVKVLILGYKDFRRGSVYLNKNTDDVNKNKEMLYKALPSLLNKFAVVSFDNLALKQLQVKRLVTEDEWNQFYMGDDGGFTMYVDLVKKQYAISSVSTERFDLLDNISDMFSVVREHKNE